jgi:predicted butyrate kinase (DUF1464 family)
MPRVVGIDPGTVTIDICGLDAGAVFLDRSIPTSEALADPSALLKLLADAAPLDLVAGPSGYGLPLVAARDVTDAELRLACLAPQGESGGIGGLRSLMRALAAVPSPVLFTPGVIHLPSVPAHRKVNRVDMGTADKVCVAALAVHEQSKRLNCGERDVELILLEMGGAFTAALAVQGGRIVDGLGGSSGPIGLRAPGALDGEVAFLAGTVSKSLLFDGGAAAIAGEPHADATMLSAPVTPQRRLALEAYLESAAKAVMTMTVAVPKPREVVLSGRVGRLAGVREALADRLRQTIGVVDVRALAGLAPVSMHAAQGAALVADGLAGGASAALVDTLGIRHASGTVLDHLYVISGAIARARLGLSG